MYTCMSECVKVVDPLAITAIKASICNAIWNALSCALIELTCYRKFMSVKRASWKHIAKPKICTHTPANKHTHIRTHARMHKQTQTSANKQKIRFHSQVATNSGVNKFKFLNNNRKDKRGACARLWVCVRVCGVCLCNAAYLLYGIGQSTALLFVLPGA